MTSVIVSLLAVFGCFLNAISFTQAGVPFSFTDVSAAGGETASCISPIGVHGNLTSIDYTLTLHETGNTWASDIFVVLYDPRDGTGIQLGGYNDFRIPAARNTTIYSLPASWDEVSAGIYATSVVVEPKFYAHHNDAICVGNGYDLGIESQMSVDLTFNGLELLNLTYSPSALPTSPSSIPSVIPSSTPSREPSPSPTRTFEPTGSPGDARDMISKTVLNNYWMEVGRVSLDDQKWVGVSTTSDDFSNAVVLLSVPSIGTESTDAGFVVVPRVRNVVVSDGVVSFEAKLYQANDSACSKEWFVPQAISPAVEMMWIVAEEGAYNVSGRVFMISSGEITRPASLGSDDSNAIRFDYPYGCVSSTMSCRFDDGTVVGAVQQLQTLVNDRFLTVRAMVVFLRFARFALIPHSSSDSSYLIISNAEKLGFMTFDTSARLDCMERISFEGGQSVSTSMKTTYDASVSYGSNLWMFGMITTITANVEATSLRAFDSSQTGFSYVLQEDQCVSAQAYHTTAETVRYFSAGELAFVTSTTICKISYHSLLNENTYFPTSSPTTPVPSSLPSVAPSFSPSAVPSISPSISLEPTGSPGDARDMISKTVLNNYWMEVGRVSLDDQKWVGVSTTSDDFSNAVVLLSVPSIGTESTDAGFVVVPRVRNVVVSDGVVSFEAKLYQANDSACSKEWFVPQAISPAVEMMWIVAEEGAYNVSGRVFMISSGEITRPASLGSDDSNAIRFDYPYGCVSSTMSCRFDDGTVVGAVQQLQTLVNDRFLTVRAMVVFLRFARFALIPHSSSDSSYLIISNAEKLGFMTFDTSARLDCMERISFEGINTHATSARSDFKFEGYGYALAMLGMITTTTANNEATSLRAFNASVSSVSFVLQEDQCVSEQSYHSTGETVRFITMGELSYVSSLLECKIYYHNKLKNIEPPTISPTSAPSSMPTGSPTSSPTELGNIDLTNPFFGANETSMETYLLVTLYDTFGDGWQSDILFSYWVEVHGETSNVISTSVGCPDSVMRAYLVPLSVVPDQYFNLVLNSSLGATPTNAWEIHWTVELFANGESTGMYYGGFNTTMIIRYSRSSDSFELSSSANLWTYPVNCFSTCRRAPSGDSMSFETLSEDFTDNTYRGVVSYEPSNYSSYAEPAWYIYDAFDASQIRAYGSTSCGTIGIACSSCLEDGDYVFRSTGSELWYKDYEANWEFCGINVTDQFRFQIEFSIVQGMCYPLTYESSESICLGTPPSRSPSSSPSATPSSSRPTCHPSSIPSSRPSSVPTTSPPTPLPSFRPTLPPTFQPTLAPTVAPTTAPTMIPTSTPSHDLSILYYYDLKKDAADPLLGPMDYYSLHGAYFEAIWENEFVLDTHDYDWGNFLYKLSLLDVYNRPLSIMAREKGASCSGCNIVEMDKFDISYECHEQVKVGYLWNALLSGVYSEMNCNNSVWKVQACPTNGTFVSRLCVDCIDPCVKAIDSSGITLPTATSKLWIPNGGHASVIGFRVEQKGRLWPTWRQEPSEIDPNSVTVVINASNYEASGGIIHCDAFPVESLPLSSEYQVLGSVHMAIVVNGTNTDEISVLIDGLKPGTSYRVYCASEAFAHYPGSLGRSPLSYMEEQAFDIVTPGNNLVYASLLQKVFIAGEPALAMTFSVDTLPMDPLVISVVVLQANSSDGSSDCSLSSVFTHSLSSNQSRLSYEFTVDANIYNHELYLRLDDPGCYEVHALLNQKNGSMYEFYLSPKNSAIVNNMTDSVEVGIQAFSENDSIPPPVVVSAKFSPDMKSIEVIFDSSADRIINNSTVGTVGAYFTCSDSLQFSFANISQCIFTTDRTLLISLPSPSQITAPLGPNIGDNVTFLPFQFKAHCRRNSSCTDYPFMNETTVSLGIAGEKMVPHVVIQTSSLLQPNHDLQLDISSSSGNCGRPWQSVKWMVFGPDSPRNTSLENYMNDKNMLRWFDCIPQHDDCDVLPRRLLSAGYYKFILSLTNILGVTSTEFSVVQVLEGDVVPNVKIHGAPSRSIFPYEPLDLKCFLDIPEVLPEYNSALSFSWSVLRDDVVSYDIKNKKTIDPRRFGTDPYDLEAGHNYVFQVILSTANGHKSMAQIDVYVKHGDIVPIITSGTDRSVGFGSLVEIDASETYDEDTGTPKDLSFWWTCEQSDPVGSRSCDRFDGLPESVLSMSVLSLNTSELFAPSSTFVLTVHVSGTWSRHAFENVKLSIAPVGVTIPEVSVTSEKGYLLNQNAENEFSGVVASDLGVDLLWTESLQGLLLETGKRWRSGVSRHSYVVQPMQFPSGPRYGFTLSAASLDCAECVGYATVKVTFNAPPKWGQLEVSPLNGEEYSTEYSLMATNWVDGDLPLVYLFSRAQEGVDVDAILRPFASSSHASSTLVSGPISSNFTVKLSVTAKDSLDSASSASAETRVFRSSSLNASGILSLIDDDIDKGNDFADSEKLLLTLADISHAYMSSRFNCSAYDPGEYSEDCIELAKLGIKLLKALFRLSEREPELCNHIIVHSVVFLEEGILSALNTSDLIQVSFGMRECIVNAPYENYAEILPSFDFFIFANGVIDKIENGIDDGALLLNGSATVGGLNISADTAGISDVDTSYPVFVDVVVVAKFVYRVLRVGEAVAGYHELSMLTIDILKSEPDASALERIGDNNSYPSLYDIVSSLSGILEGSSAVGIVRVVTGRGYTCDHETLLCIPLTGEVYSQVFVSTTQPESVANASRLGNFDLYRLSSLNLSSLVNVTTDYDPAIHRESCPAIDSEQNATSFDFTCIRNDTHGEPFQFYNLTCLPIDGNNTWELSCPVYNTILACAARQFGSTENEFHPMDSVIDGEGAYSCSFDLSDAWALSNSSKDLPLLASHDTLGFERIVAGVFATPVTQSGLASISPRVFEAPTMFPTANIASKSSGEGSMQYTSFPAGLTLLGIFSMAMFFLAIWISMAGKTPKIYSKKSLV